MQDFMIWVWLMGAVILLAASYFAYHPMGFVMRIVSMTLWPIWVLYFLLIFLVAVSTGRLGTMFGGAKAE